MAHQSASALLAVNTQRERAEGLEAQIRRADARVEELRSANELLLQQVTMLSDSARPTYDQIMASLPAGTAPTADSAAGEGLSEL
jgi:hypothetical protein